MSENLFRDFLVTKFACATCGEPLKLSYGRPKGSDYREGEPTGAAMVSQIVAVEPCARCLSPGREVAEAMRVLLAAANKGGA